MKNDTIEIINHNLLGTKSLLIVADVETLEKITHVIEANCLDKEIVRS